MWVNIDGGVVNLVSDAWGLLWAGEFELCIGWENADAYSNFDYCLLIDESVIIFN